MFVVSEDISAWIGTLSLNFTLRLNTNYSATTWTGPLRTKLTNQSVNWEQRMAPFFVNGPMKLKNANNGLTTKIWNPTKLRRVADVTGNFVTISLVRFDPFFFEQHWSSLYVAATKEKDWKDFFAQFIYAYKRRSYRVGMKQNFYLLSFTTHCRTVRRN